VFAYQAGRPWGVSGSAEQGRTSSPSVRYRDLVRGRSRTATRAQSLPRVSECAKSARGRPSPRCRGVRPEPRTWTGRKSRQLSSGA
jgi:hypothetical protein